MTLAQCIEEKNIKLKHVKPTWSPRNPQLTIHHNMPPIRNQALAPFSAKATLVVEPKVGARKELQFNRLTKAEIMEKRAKE